MKLQERSYSGKVIRPKPHVHVEDDGSLLILATSWGQAEHAVLAANEVAKYVNAAKEDIEVTSHFEFMTCLSDEANYVRTALLIANEALYRGENRREYSSGVELLALFRRGQQVAWAHVGSPSLFIQRKNQNLQPLSIAQDLSSEISSPEELMPALPGQLLGLDPTCDVRTGHVLLNAEDQLILLSSAQVAPALWCHGTAPWDIASVTQRMIQESPSSAFWLGLVAAS